MPHLTALLCCAVTGLLLWSPAATAQENADVTKVTKDSEKSGAEKETTEKEPAKLETLKIKDLTLRVPESWTAEEPSSRMRVGQFSVKPAEGDEEAGELTIFNFAGGGGAVQANLTRWAGQFAAEGRKASVKKGTSDQGQYILLDVTGTFKKPVGPPIRRQTENREDYRMIAVILAIPEKGNYYLKLTGPEKTVTAQAEAMRAAIGADMEKEEDYTK